MSREIPIMSIDKVNSEKLELDLKLYGFGIGYKELEKLLVKEEEPLSMELGSGYFSKETVELRQVKKIINNSRGTLKLVIFSDGKFTLFNKQSRPAGLLMVHLPWSPQGNVLWDELQEGLYVVCTQTFYYREHVIGLLTDCKTREEAQKWLNLYSECLDYKRDYGMCEEFEKCRDINCEGKLTLQDLENRKNLMLLTIEQIKKLEAEEEKKKSEALQNKISIEGETVKVDALDDHSYSIELPAQVFKKEDWTDYVYRHRYTWKPYNQQAVKQDSLFRDVLYKLMNSKVEWFKIGVDNKDKVKVAVKTLTNKRGQSVTVTYLNDKRVSQDQMVDALYNYFIKGEEMTGLEEEKDLTEEEKKIEVRKRREEALISSGIKGYITDLEGETPISLGFEKIGNNWYLVVGEKKLMLRGGVSTIKSLERILTGSAHSREARHSSEEFYRRLSQVLTPEEAVEVINTAKEIGRLMKALGTDSIN